MYFDHAPKHMIRLSVEYQQDLKIPIRGHPYVKLNWFNNKCELRWIMTIQKYSWIEFVSELIDFVNMTLID